ASYAQAANGHLGKWQKETKINWDAFLERLSQLAKNQHQLPWDQKQYAKQVRQLLLKCDFPEFENVKKEMEAYENRRPDWFEAASLHYEVDFQVSLFQFEKGEYIPHHDHPDMTGVLNVVSGSILAKNYNIEEQYSSTEDLELDRQEDGGQKCIIREVGNEIIKGGNVGTLTAHEGNIHSIMPMEFTQLVDVFTPAYHQNTNGTWFKVKEEEWYQGLENLYEAEYSAERPE
ncbi:MAG: hypothetical protein AAF985_10470, partial [Bacteroidota bacterium]